MRYISDDENFRNPCASETNRKINPVVQHHTKTTSARGGRLEQIIFRVIFFSSGSCISFNNEEEPIYKKL